MKKWICLLLMTQFASADVNLKFDLESKIRDRIKALVSPADPDAQILVNVTLKSISVDLPGVGMRAQNFVPSEVSGVMNSQDIESIHITVISKLEPFPASLKLLVSRAVEVPRLRANIVYEKMAGELMTAIQNSESNSESARAWKGLTDRLDVMNKFENHRNYIYYGLGALFLLVVVLAMVYLHTIVDGQISKLASAVNTMRAPEERPAMRGRSVSEAIIDASSSPLPVLGQGKEEDRAFIQSLSAESVAALLSDCYWGEKDSYAAWLWSRFSSAQRTQILMSWPTANGYVQTLSESEAAYEPFHNHPYYLKPLPLMDVNQKNLELWVKKHPFTWHMISPIRQLTLPFPIMEKIHFSTIEKSNSTPPLPAAARDFRNLKSHIQIGDISESDELDLLRNSLAVPKGVRSQIISLVWLAQVPAPLREKLLASISAQQLAQAWVGPREILSIIEQSLDERKIKLLHEYTAVTTPSRQSPVMLYLVQESLKLMHEDTALKIETVVANAS